MTERVQTTLIPEAGEPWSKNQYLVGRLSVNAETFAVSRPMPIIEIIKDNGIVTDRIKAIK
jgi:hypothetical protein